VGVQFVGNAEESERAIKLDKWNSSMRKLSHANTCKDEHAKMTLN